MATYRYTTEIVKKDAAGNYSVVDLVIDTDYTSVTSGNVATEFTVDGVSLGPVAPTLFTSTGVNRATVTLEDGSTTRPGIMSFTVGTDEYYIMQGGSGSTMPGSGHIDPNRVTDVAITTKVEMLPNAFHSYTQFKIVDSSTSTYQGDALMVLDGSSGLWVENVYAFDDDALLELTGETGLAVEAWAAGTWGGVPLGLDTTFYTSENIVTVNYTTATGSGSFDAIAVSYSTRTYYIPEEGHADLDTITAVTSVTDTGVPFHGSAYADFGLGSAKFVQKGGADGETLVGDIGHDKILGKKGDDLIFGDAGDDRLDGGSGKDTIYGGAGVDKLIGGKNKDTLFGGMDDDTLLGGLGDDVLEGGTGNDTLKGEDDKDTLRGDRGDDTLRGGKGNDTLKGGAGADVLKGDAGKDTLSGQAGADTLDGGKGSDILTGGKGADIFVFAADGKQDTITDFEDGKDKIDLDVAFGVLTITDVSAGTVEITHSGESLIVEDGGLGLLSAADFTADDFL